jgi:hypothetical protein
VGDPQGPKPVTFPLPIAVRGITFFGGRMNIHFPRTVEKMRTLILFILLVTVPLSFQCVNKPLAPKAPQWPVPLNVQLIDRTFTFGQMIEKDPKFITDSVTSSVEYRPSSLVNKPNPITLPELTPLQAQVTNKLGLLSLNVASISGITVAANQLFPSNALPFTYISPPLPPAFDTSLTQPVLNPGALYDWVLFQNGEMTLTIHNNFPFTVNLPSGIQLVNTDIAAGPSPSNFVVATFTFPGGVAPGSTGQSTQSVNGIVMSDNLVMNFRVTSNDIVGQQITKAQNLTGSMVVDGGGAGINPTVSKASIQLSTPYDVKNLPDSSVQIVDDSTKIKRAEFKDGQFNISITNDIATRIAVEFHFNEFVDRVTGQPFKLVTDTIPARNQNGPGKLLQTVFMKDYAIQSQNIVNSGGKTDTLSVPNVHFSLKIKTLAATQSRVVISKDDSVQVSIDPQNNTQTPPRKTYVLSKVIGKVKPTPVPINETVDAAIGDLGNKFRADSIKFDSVSITLKVLSTGSFPTDLTMRIIGLDKNGVRRDSMKAQDLKPGGGLTDTMRINPGVEKKIIFNKTTSRIDAFLSTFFSGGNGSLPNKFLVVGQALVDPKSYYQYPDSTGTIKVGDSVFTSVEFLFPVRIGIINGTYVDTISIADTSGNKIDKKSLTQIDSGKVIFTISNSFPFQLDVSSKLLPGLATNRSKPDTTTLLLLPKSGAIHADSARYASTYPFHPGNPNGLTATVIGLTTDDIDKINPANFVAVNIRMNTAGSNKPVEFKSSYYVQLKAFLSVQYNINFDKLK